MSRLLLPAIIWSCAACAIAQPVQNAAPDNDRQVAREQRRAELRTALQANRQVNAHSAGVEDPIKVARHLSPRERAEMRQQLRQQQVDSSRVRP